MRKLVKEQMGKRLLNLVDELATSYGQGTYAHIIKLRQLLYF